MSEWRTIDSAPRDGTRILLYIPSYGPYVSSKVVIGQWEIMDRRPYFTNDCEMLYGVKNTRKHQPTHWMPLPEPLTDATP